MAYTSTVSICAPIIRITLETLYFCFVGGYNDNYRTPFPNTANSGYGQTQFNTPRDYPNGNYQRV